MFWRYRLADCCSRRGLGWSVTASVPTPARLILRSFFRLNSSRLNFSCPTRDAGSPEFGSSCESVHSRWWVVGWDSSTPGDLWWRGGEIDCGCGDKYFGFWEQARGRGARGHTSGSFFRLLFIFRSLMVSFAIWKG
jgi:hypothetical protein